MLFVVFIFTSLFHQLTSRLVIVSDPLNTFGLENQNVALICRFTYSNKQENFSAHWYYNGSPIKANAVHYQNTSEFLPDGVVVHSLNFPLLRRTEGRYYFNVSTSKYWVASKEANVKIAFLNEQFLLEPQDKIVSLGETVLLECLPPTGMPKPTVHWTKNNLTVSPDERTHISENGNLRINRVQWEDRGIYTCIAESFAFRRQSLGAVLNVRHRPYFLESPLSQSVTVHSSFELSCRAAGDPPPVILWRREPAFLGVPFERTQLLPTGALRFIQVRLQDAGDYICRAVSQAGIIESMAHINVVYPPSLILTPPSSVSVLEGERVVLPCAAVGSPSPDVRWIRLKPLVYYLAESDPAGRISVTFNGSLTISSVRRDDASHYECRASSSVGVARSLTYIDVKSNQILEPARFGALSSRRLSLRLSKTTTNVRIICEFPVFQFESHILSSVSLRQFSVSRSNLTLFWLVEGGSLFSRFGNTNRAVVEQSGSLLIRDVQNYDEGNYTCFIFNHISRRYSTWTTELLIGRFPPSLPMQEFDVAQLPKPPTNLTITNVGDDWLSVQWDDVDDGSHFISYKVFYLPVTVAPESPRFSAAYRDFLFSAFVRQTSLNSTPVLDVWSSTTSTVRHRHARLVGLLPGMGYWIEVRKANLFGLSPGFCFPRIVYTLNRTSQRFTGGIMINSSGSNSLQSGYNSILIGFSASSDFQQLTSGFQSVSFSELNLRSLTPNELLMTWVTHSTMNVLRLINGFKINIKPVPMSRCLVTASSSTISHLRSFPFISPKDLSFMPNADLKQKSSAPPIHCSLSTDVFLEQILRMSTDLAAHDPTDAIASDQPLAGDPVEQTIFLWRTVSATSPVAKAVGSGLMPFTCYEVVIEAFMDDSTYGRIWSPSSRPELALTLDSSPTYAPPLVAAEWLLAAPKDSVNQSLPTLNSVRLKWKPLGLRMAHGALIGYMIHLITNESYQSRSLKVPPDVHSKDVFGINPHVEYLIYLSGVTCRGEGVRGPGYRLPPAAYFLRDVHESKSHTAGITRHVSAEFPPWAYGVIIVTLLFWFIVGLFITVCNRIGLSKRQTQEKHNTYVDSEWYWPSFSYPLCVHRPRFARKRSADLCAQHLVTEYLHRSSLGAAPTSQFVADRHLQHVCNQQLYFSTESFNTAGSPEECKKYPVFLKCNSSGGSVAKNDPLSEHLLTTREHLKDAGRAIRYDTEVYANSASSLTSNGFPDAIAVSSPSPRDEFITSHLASDIDPHQSTKLRLPDSIAIPYPVAPSHTPGAISCSYISGLVVEPTANNVPAGFLTTYNFSSLGDDEIVPPYASCAVSSISASNFPSLNQGAQPHVQRTPRVDPGEKLIAFGYGSTSMSQNVTSQCPSTSSDRNMGSGVTLRHTDVLSSLSPQSEESSCRTTIQSAACSHFLTVSNSLYPIPPPPTYPPPPPPLTGCHWDEFPEDRGSSCKISTHFPSSSVYLPHGSPTIMTCVSTPQHTSFRAAFPQPRTDLILDCPAPCRSVAFARTASKFTSLLRHLRMLSVNTIVSTPARTSTPSAYLRSNCVTNSTLPRNYIGCNSLVTDASERSRYVDESMKHMQPHAVTSFVSGSLSGTCSGVYLDLNLSGGPVVMPFTGLATTSYTSEFTNSTDEVTNSGTYCSDLQVHGEHLEVH
ncbi:unnamed protein product [Dicrocoelium dendriticum]|nr:unnamed protein product [Dicrocoelium dendriticum]